MRQEAASNSSRAQLVESSPRRDRHEPGVVGNRASQRKPGRVAHPDRVTERWLCQAKARGSRWQKPTNLFVRDHQQLRVDRSHDAAGLQLL